MTESEAIKNLKDILDECTESEEAVCYVTDVDAPALEMAINALEKQIPKKPRNERSSVPLSRTSVRFVDWYKCGKCNFDLSKQFVCCPYCQSVIDWSDVD